MKNKNIWIVIPAWRRYGVSSFVFEELRWMADVLLKRKIKISIVVIADDENLNIAKKYGFHTVVQNNKYLGKKFNDGYEYAFKNGADAVIPSGSDSWIHPNFFLTSKCNTWKDKGYVLVSTQRALINESGEKFAIARDDVKGRGYNKGVLWVYPRSIMKKCKFRPCVDTAKSSCDRHTIEGITKASGKITFIEHNHMFQQTVGFKNKHVQLWPYSVAKKGILRELSDPWGRLESKYPKGLVNNAKSFYFPKKKRK
tara:strand:+ start:676 stop:1440 length:765 start_codon:yes stop_codon:yes gene_type:complete